MSVLQGVQIKEFHCYRSKIFTRHVDTQAFVQLSATCMKYTYACNHAHTFMMWGQSNVGIIFSTFGATIMHDIRERGSQLTSIIDTLRHGIDLTYTVMDTLYVGTTER